MNIGDLIMKSSGNLDLNEMGLVVKIIHNPSDETIVTVITPDGFKNWYGELVTLIDEDA